ncbi:L,D-transpeptidase [Streptomyces sp. NPDC048270]|uniref:L,D-transpeptidase family protein n=1 Tax=Streptomyces sp. NPDC048270 TaxID=3154615 RepID=UPI0033D3D99B
MTAGNAAGARAKGAGAAAAALAAAALLTLAGPVPPHAAAAQPRSTAADGPGAPCAAGTGPYQRELEEHLGRPVDGVQSPADCEAIGAFQRGRGIRPADGYAGLATYRTMVAVAAAPNPNAAGGCPVRTYRVTCVDLDRQLLWVQRDRRVVFAPVPIRTGRDDQETRPGWHEVYWRSKDHVSTLYDDAPMPYAQFFDGGQALHGRPGDLYAHGGSAGCVNLSVPDAARLWDLLTEGDAVYVWGTKPGTDD